MNHHLLNRQPLSRHLLSRHGYDNLHESAGTQRAVRDRAVANQPVSAPQNQPRQRPGPAAWLAVVLLFALPLTLACAQSDDFIPLFDGTLEGWTIENSSHDNFTIHDGVLRVEEPEGWLKSEQQYGDFVLRIEFRFLTDNADSGIFVRAVADSPFIRGWPNNSYQVQLRNPLGESPFPPVGGVFRHGTPQGPLRFDADDAARLSTGTGEWQTLQIELAGEELTVWLNGSELSHASNIVNAQGYIGIQAELGTVEFRSIGIQER